MKPNYMIDCQACGRQNWKVGQSTGMSITAVCDFCGQKCNIQLNDMYSGEECLQCQHTSWELVEQTDDHIIIRCTYCDEIAELWLNSCGT